MATKKTTKRTKKTKKTLVAATSAKSANTSVKTNASKLRNWNMALALILLAQAIVILVISKGISLPVVDHYLAKDTLASQTANKTVLALTVRHLFDIHLASLLAAILIIAAAIRGLAGSLFAKRYQAGIESKVNRMRWAECAFAGGLVIVTIGLINGVYDISQLVTLFALTLLAAVFLLVLEQNSSKFAPWIVNTFAILAALLPWLVVGQYLKGALIYGNGLPHYIYWVDGALFAIFIAQAVNFYLQRRGTGAWKNYIYSEKVFMFLSLATYSTLAWVVFAGVLR